MKTRENKKTCLCALVALLAITSWAKAEQSQKDWRVLPAQARCLLENLQAYRKAKSQPVVIFLSVCPTVDQSEALRKIQQNNGALPKVRESEGKPLDDVIVYTQTELNCLSGFSIDKDSDVVELPANPCAE